VRPSGVPGLLINEVSIKGIVRNSSGFVALIQGPDNKSYVVKAGDRLMDGTVKSIVQDAVVFSQDVNDPLSLVKQKEIRKPLRVVEGGRG
jgi:Tfp pilus assembly protein PilP